MRQTTDIYKSLRNEIGSWYEIQIVRGDSIYGIDKIKSCSMDFAAFSYDGPSIGGTRSNQCQFVILESSENWPTNDKFYIRARLVNSEETQSSEWITLGTFITDTRFGDLYGNLTVTAFDEMLMLEQSVPSTAETDIAWPATAYTAATYLAKEVGLQIDPRTVLDDSVPFIPYDENSSIRSIFSDIAAGMGGNWQITPEGKLRLIELNEARIGSSAIAGIAVAGISIVGDDSLNDLTEEELDYLSLGLKMKSLSIGEPLEAITGVELETETGEYSSFGTDDGLVIKAICNFADERIAEICLNRLNGIRYRPFSAAGALLDPAAEIGDIIIIDGKMYQLITANWQIGTDITCDISAPDAEEVNQRYTMVPETTKVLRKASGLVKEEIKNREEAIAELSNALSGASGLYQTTETPPGGGAVYYLHDKSTLGASSLVIKLTADALGISTDGGRTYAAGYDFATSTAITNILQAAGINADWINTGALTVYDSGGDILFQADKDSKFVFFGGFAVNQNGFGRLIDPMNYSVFNIGDDGFFIGVDPVSAFDYEYAQIDTNGDVSCHDLTVHGRNVPEELDELSSKGLTLLWENTNPTALFAPQNIYVEGLSGFSIIMVEICWSNSSSGRGIRGSAIATLETNATMNPSIITYNSGMQYVYRECQFRAADRISFGTGNLFYSTGQTSGDAYAIPLRIYGIK